MYVIQERVKPWSDKYETLKYLPRYSTLAEARAALEKRSFKSMCRIAEEYTVTRYKAVK